MATKDCTFFVDINGRQVEMDFDGFRAYLMQDGVMATLAPDLTAKRGKKAGFTVTAQKAEPTPARAEAPKARAEGTTKKTEAPAPTELEVSAENLRKLMPKLGKRRAEAIIAVMKAMGIPFDRLKLAKGKVEAKGALQQADVKARDAEYMAAVKAGDTAKAQRMVEEAAKAAGYTTGPVEHGSGARFTQFKPEFQGTVTEAKSTSGAWFFTDGTRTAKGYAVYAAEEGPIKQLMRQAEAAERKGDWDTYERLIQQAEDAVYGEEGAAATAERRKNAVVYKGFLRGKFKTIDAQGETPATLSASEDFVEFDGSITAAISAAKRQGFDGLIIQNLDDAPGVVEVANHFVVWDSSQFKSADPITYDDKGNVIPLSQRFKAESPDIRYQGEASPLGSITFIDDLNALISVFEKANFSTVLHEAMHFYRRHMLNTAQGFTAEEIKRFERWAGAKNGKWTVEAEEKAARAFEKYLRDGLAPIPELRELFRKVARWMREVYATLTGSPVDIDIPADIRQIFDRIFTLEAERQKGVVGKEVTPTAGARSLQQIDTKARDAEYMAAVKAGDTAKAQGMVEEAAKIAGYNETGSHGLAEGKLEGNAFDLERLGSNTGAASARLGFFFGSQETARTYAQVQINPEKAEQVASMARDIITPLLDVVPKGASRELDFARDSRETLFSPESQDILEPESYVTGVYAEVARLLDEALEVAEGYGSIGLTLNLMADEANKAIALLKKQPGVQDVVGPNGESLTDASFSAFDVEDDDVAGFSTYLKHVASSLRSQYPTVAKAFKDAAAKGDAFMSPKEQSLRDTLREAQEKLDNTLGHVPFYAILDTAQVDAVLRMENPLVHDQQGVRYREQTYYDIIQQAKAQGHDSVIIKNTYDGGPLDDIKIVFEPSQIKSADPITYDDKGNVIPLSERFKPSTPDIRYQREGEGVPQAETATAVYRRAMKEQQQEKAAKALQSLNQPRRGVRKPATFAPAQPRPSLEITPVNRRAVIETMQELREFKRKLTEQKGGLAAATDADLDKWEKLLNRIEQLGGVNPITPQMDAKYQAVINAGVVGKRGQTVQAALDKAASTAFGVPEVTRVPDIRKWQAVDWEEEIDWQEDKMARRIVLEELELTEDDVDWNDIREEDVYILGFQDSDVWGEWDWEDIPDFEDVRQPTLLAYPRVKIAGKENAIGDLVHEFMILQGEERMGEKTPPAPLPLEVETGRPIVAQVFRGGTFEGTEFQSQFLGKLTNAQSARMGYFFAATPQTANAYTKAAERTVSPKIADSVATPATRPYYVYMSNPLVHDNESSKRRTVPLPKLIRKALKDGHDGVIVKNIYDPVEDHVFIVLPGHENQIKSAEPETSDSRGNLIPLSERFNPATKNVLYQGEDPLPNPEGTSTEAFRRKQAEQRQKNLIDAMNRLRQGQAQAPKGEPKAAQPKAAKEPSQARQGQTRAPRAARTAASTPRRGFGGKSLDEIFDALLRQAKAGQLGVSKEAPATPSELLEERIKRGLRDVLDAVYNKRVQPESAVDTARNAAANLLAAHQAGEQSAIDAATAEFRQVVSESRKAARGPQAPRPPRPKATVAERYAKMMDRVNEKPKPAAKATPAELAEMTVRQLLRQMEKQLKVAKSQGIDVEQMEVNGATVSRKEFFVNAADEYQDAYVKQDIPRQQAAYDRMRMAVDTIVTSLHKGKTRPNWHGLRSPLSYANVIGSYEGVMGQLGAEISELFKRTRTDINNKVMTFSEGMSFLQEQMNKVYKPMMKAQGYYGMPAIIDEHIKYLRFTAAFSARYTKIRKEQSIFKDPKAWYTTRRDLSREVIDGESAAFPMAAAMIKSVVYTAKLKYNLKSASTNYISLALSVGPYMRANELADIIYEAAKPSTWNRKVAGDRTLRDVAVGETGGRQAEGAPADEGLTHWWHRKDIFQLSSEHVRIAGYLVGERMAEREDQKLRAEGKAPLSDYVKARLIRDWIEKVEFDNSPWNIAPWFRGPVASVAFQFKPFLQKNVERFIADLQRDPEAFVLSDPRTPLGQITNKIPWKYRRVIGTIGQQVMWGGIGSLLTAVPYLKPLAGVFILAGLMNALKGMTDDDEFAEDLAVAIYYGAPAAIGTDLSSSVGFFEEPYGKTVHEQAVNFFLGPLASTALNVVQEDIKFLETAQKEPRLGGEEEKRKEMLRRGVNIAKQVTPYVRMVESAVDLAQGEGSTMRLDKEEKLTKWETAIRALGGAPIKQTMFFDEKEAYGWQKSLLGKPTGFERLKKKEGESDASYFRRKAKTDQWERTYLRRLEQNPRYRRLKPEEQEAVRENLWRNFAEESGKLRPDTSKFDASGLLERRAERVRSR